MAVLPRLSCPVIMRVYRPSGVDSGMVYSSSRYPLFAVIVDKLLEKLFYFFSYGNL